MFLLLVAIVFFVAGHSSAELLKLSEKQKSYDKGFRYGFQSASLYSELSLHEFMKVDRDKWQGKFVAFEIYSETMKSQESQK